jgi:cytochrome c556
MKNGCVIAVLMAAVGLGSVMEAAAQQRKPEDSIKMRRAAFTLISWNFGTIGAMAKGQIPYDQAEAVKRAEAVQFLGNLHWEGFVKGTSTEDGGETRALPAIWSEPDKFKSAVERFQSESVKLVQAAKSGDAGQLKAQFGATAKSCSNCHDNFRRK